METFTFKSVDGTLIKARVWSPDSNMEPVGAIQIAHGMAEHSLRYNWFAGKLIDEGFIVYANDHRGHGETAQSDEFFGHFSDQNGWDRVVQDMMLLNSIIREKHKNIPFFIFGHSMGSLLLRDLVTKYEKGIKGIILSGTSGHPGIRGYAGLSVAKIQSALAGERSLSTMMDRLTFKSFNKTFAPVSTPFDWLSRDRDMVDNYIKDPYCGFICTAKFYADVIGGVIKVNSMNHIRKTPEDISVLFASGTMDPVGHYGRGVTSVYRSFVKAGIKDVDVRLYSNSRHEILNELNREEVAEDMLNWLRFRI